MLEFLALNFNLPTLIGAGIVFGGTGWLLWHSHKSGGACSSCGGCSGCDLTAFQKEFYNSAFFPSFYLGKML